MGLRITRPYFADCARGSLFPRFRLTTKGPAGYLAALSWPPPNGGYKPGPGAALLAQRAQVRPTQTIYRLDGSVNHTQQAARVTFPATGQRITYTGQNIRVEWGPITGTRVHYLASHPPATKTNHASPCTP